MHVWFSQERRSRAPEVTPGGSVGSSGVRAGLWEMKPSSGRPFNFVPSRMMPSDEEEEFLQVTRKFQLHKTDRRISTGI